MKHIDIVDILAKQYMGQTVDVCGWVRSGRDSKNVAFLSVNDGTTLEHLQVVLDKAVFADVAPFLRLGVAVKVTGKVVDAVAKEGGVEINAEAVKVLGECPLDYPLQKKRHTMEYLRTIPQLRLRTNTFNAVFRVRSVLAGALHAFFQVRHFSYIHTPLITGSDCEGAGEVFRVTTHPFDTPYKTEEEYYANDFFGKKAGLSVSGQLEGEVAAMAMGKIYTFGPSFRAEKSNTPRHLAEFWHLEPEVAFAELPDVIELAESMIKYVIGDLMHKCPAEIAFFEQHFEQGLTAKLKNIVDNDFAILDYTDAIDLLNKAAAEGVEFQYPHDWGCDLQTEHERYITEKVYNKPVFVINYPKAIKSFYMKQNADGKTVAATDLLVPGVGEIIGGSEREADLDKLLAAMTERNMNMDAYADYLDLRKFGSCPHGGFGLGFDRLVMYVTGMSNIRDVLLYPRTVGSLR